jgi:carbamoylphosphate synthase large subunit
MEHRILVTGAGGGGGENLINSLRRSRLDLVIYGSNMDENLLVKSSADVTVWLPGAKEESYTDCLERLIQQEAIELVVPNNDTEVGRISKDRDKLSCKVFLPPHETVVSCQDKLKMYGILCEAGIPVAKSTELRKYEDIDAFMTRFSGDRYWVRPRRGSGSMGATWVKNAEQARAWINLWIEMRGFSLNDFTVSEFLPGRDYAFQSVWKSGELVVAKLAERLVYFMGRTRLSNMSSTPAVARTVRDEKALKTIFEGIHALSSTPHGNYCMDLKGNGRGEMCITEFNIGRFMMITPIFDLTGKYNTADIYVRCALDEEVNIDDPIDIEENVYLIRELDTLPTIIRENELKDKVREAKQFLSFNGS